MEFQKCWKDERVSLWTQELLEQLEKIDNTITRTVDHWVDSVLGEFMTEFAIDQFVSYYEAEQLFFKGFRGKFLRTLPLLIKKLLCEKNILCSHTD